MATFFSTTCQHGRKNSILAEVRLGAKKGVVCACSKMNIYFKEPPFAPDFGLFAAKWGAFCR